MTARPRALHELQIVVQARLTGDATLSSMVRGIGEEAPEGQPYPYISYGEHVDGPNPTFGHLNHSGFFLLHIWSNALATDECFAIEAEIIRLLVDPQTAAPLVLPSYGSTALSFDWSTILRDQDDPEVWHMPIRLASWALD